MAIARPPTMRPTYNGFGRKVIYPQRGENKHPRKARRELADLAVMPASPVLPPFLGSGDYPADQGVKHKVHGDFWTWRGCERPYFMVTKKSRLKVKGYGITKRPPVTLQRRTRRPARGINTLKVEELVTIDPKRWVPQLPWS